MKTAPLRRLIQSASQQNVQVRLVWDDEAELAFVNVKTDLRTASALASADSSKPFLLYVSEKNS